MHEWAPPTELKELRLLRPLKKGGMGEVWLFHDTDLDRRVAVKFLLDEDPSSDRRERFLTEGRALARIKHANVVTVHRVGEVEGRPYLVMEVVRGNPLDAVERPVSRKRLLELAVGLASGLAAAH